MGIKIGLVLVFVIGNMFSAPAVFAQRIQLPTTAQNNFGNVSIEQGNSKKPGKSPTLTITLVPTNTVIPTNTTIPTSAVFKPGDLNHDDLINVLDLSILMTNFGTTARSADINQDAQVNVMDLSILLSNFGK